MLLRNKELDDAIEEHVMNGRLSFEQLDKEDKAFLVAHCLRKEDTHEFIERCENIPYLLSKVITSPTMDTAYADMATVQAEMVDGAIKYYSEAIQEIFNNLAAWYGSEECLRLNQGDRARDTEKAYA